MRILYIGQSNSMSTSLQRANALERIGHQVQILNPYDLISFFLESKYLRYFHYRTGYIFLQKKMAAFTKEMVEKFQGKVDLIWVDNGELLGVNALNELKKLNSKILLYNIDDPTGKRDAMRWRTLKRALFLYDGVAVVRNENIKELEALHVSQDKIKRVFRSYDEVAHNPYASLAQIPSIFHSDIVFLGTCIPGEGRGSFLRELIEAGLKVSIWGDGWEKDCHWQFLKSNWRGPSLIGRDYVAAIQGAKICLGFLSKGNRDLHTTRSLEIPYAGGLLLAQRTSEHLDMYKEGVEAEFWDTSEECIEKCNLLLRDNLLRESIRASGMSRVRKLNLGHESVCKSILDSFQ